MQYLRIPRNKFWGWVLVSLLVGLGIGLGIMFWNSASSSSRIASLEARLSDAGTDTSAAVAAEARAANAEASVTALTAQTAQLTADLAAANATIESLQGGAATTPTETLAVTSRSITPSSVSASGTITMTAKVTGSPDSVKMRVYTASKSFDKTYTLKKVSTSGDTGTWRLAVKAPAKTGTYRYFATAKKGTISVTMPGASPKSFTVK